MVEVDAATLGVGVVLSQWKGEPPVLHPCAYFSKKLSPAEQNYDVGNRELLAIKLALEEWRHWLEGAKHPFVVITDHKNLQYLQEAKRLNPRQARWALFVTRFRFTISYRPGSKNIKADALSRLHQTDPTTEKPEPILPHSIFTSPVLWNLDNQIQAATLLEPAPPGGPEGKKYVPSILRLTLLDSVHTFAGIGTPKLSPDPFTPPEPLLVAQHDPRCHSLCPGVFDLCHLLHTTPSTRGKTGPVAHSSPTLVSPGSRLCHRSSSFKRIHHHPGCRGPILQILQINPTTRITVGPRNSWVPLLTHIQELRSPRRHSLRQGAPVHL